MGRAREGGREDSQGTERREREREVWNVRPYQWGNYFIGGKSLSL